MGNNKPGRNDAVRSRPPSIEAMRALVAFHDAEESVTLAAKMLDLSQPVVSTKLKIFRDHSATGAVLIARPVADRPFQLTDAGQAAIPGMKELVRQYDHVLSSIAGASKGPLLVRIASGSFSAEHLIPSALSSVSQIVKACDIRTFVARGRERILGVASGEYDLAVVSHSEDQIRETLEEASLPKDAVIPLLLSSLPLFVAASPKTNAGQFLLDRVKNTVRVDQLVQWELVGLDRRSGLRRMLQSKCPATSPLSFQVEGGGWNASREFAKVGLGVAILPAAAIQGISDSELVIRRLSNSFQSTEYVIHRNGAHLVHAHAQIISALKKSAKVLAEINPQE